MKFTIKRRKLGSAELRELKARSSALQDLALLAAYSGLNLSAIHGILRGVAVIEAFILILCALIPWFFSTLSHVTGYVFSRGVRSKLLANLFITSDATNLAVCVITSYFQLSPSSPARPDMLIRQLETGALGFWGFLLLAVLGKAGLIYSLIVIPMFTGAILILMEVKRRPVLGVY